MKQAYNKIRMATVTAFMFAFCNIAQEYNWEEKEDGEIVGKPKSKKRPQDEVDPLTAVLNDVERKRHKPLSIHTFTPEQVKPLGMPEQTHAIVTSAIDGSKNRGYTPVLRGRMKRVCGLKSTNN